MMHIFVPLAVVGILMAGCSPETSARSEGKACASKLYPNYNPKNLSQCVDVCTKCENGAPAACSTSCNLRGAR